jgi:hypothetical protein
MAKRLNNDPQAPHRKLDIEQHEPHQKPGVNSSCASEEKQFLFHMWHPLFYSCYITGDKSWMSKVIRGHFWCRYSVTVNQVMVATLKRSKWWLQLNPYRNPWSSSFLVRSNPLSRDSWKIYRINWEIYTCTPYVGVMLLHIYGKLTMGKLK